MCSLCEFRFNWASWILSANPVWVLNSQQGQGLPTGQFQSNRKETVQRAKPYWSCMYSYYNDIEFVGVAPNGYWMTVGPSAVI